MAVFDPNAGQRDVMTATDPVLLVLGGAGTGKTTAAANAAVEHLRVVEASRDHRDPTPRVLFLSFSKASVAQVVERSAAILGRRLEQVEFTTFHGLAWQLVGQFGGLVGQFGGLVGHPDPRLVTEARATLLGDADGLRYADLIPTALRVAAVPAVGGLLRSRWGLIVCDEFQDTADEHYELLLALRGDARLLLLGDPNQCIYSNLPGTTGVGPERLAAAMALPGARQVDLPEASYRDPSQVLPAAAAAIQRQEYAHPAVAAAVDSGRLEVRSGLDPAAEAATVADTVAELLPHGSVAVFSHHVDLTADLSDALLELRVPHEVVGIPESLATAMDAQVAMIGYAAGVTGWDDTLERLAVSIVSSVRGNKAVPLARIVLGQEPAPRALADRIDALRGRLDAADLPAAAAIATGAHEDLGLQRGSEPWARAAALLVPPLRASVRSAKDDVSAARNLAHAARDSQAAVLTYAHQPAAHRVQIMGLYQSKGREADATVVVIRADDYFGRTDPASLEGGLRLLYVVLTRARERTVVLTFGTLGQGLVAPLTRLRGSAGR